MVNTVESHTLVQWMQARNTCIYLQYVTLLSHEQTGSVCYSPSPATVGITMPLDEKDRTANEEQAKNSLSLDSSQPITTVQIRLADGSRLLGQFNHSHTIADVRRFITTYPLYKSPMLQGCKIWFLMGTDIKHTSTLFIRTGLQMKYFYACCLQFWFLLFSVLAVYCNWFLTD
jgi:hypothetical protein